MAISDTEFQRLLRDLEREFEERRKGLYKYADRPYPSPSRAKQKAGMAPANRKAQPSTRREPEPELVLEESSGPLSHQAPIRETLSLADKIKGLIQSLPAQFGMQEMKAALIATYPSEAKRPHLQPTITSYLNRLERSGQLMAVEGAKRPKLFQLRSHQQHGGSA